MKRVNNLFEQIATADNLELADKKARKGKKHQHGIQLFDQDRESNLASLLNLLHSGNYRTSPYTTFLVYEPKEREVFRLPYRDRIVHHAIMNILEPYFVSWFTADSYSCIKGRGIHGAAYALKKALRDEAATRYCLKLDIQKFYPSINHDVLKNLLRRKIKDRRLLLLLDEIIDSAEGLPIGNYLSQYFANFYLTGFDNWIKQENRVKYYFRYLDDIVILAATKEELHRLIIDIKAYLSSKLRLTVKNNWQVYPVASRGIDFVGYVSYHTHTRLRKSIKKNFAIKMARNPNQQSMASYYGWCKHANCINLFKKLTNDCQIQRPEHQTQIQSYGRGEDKNQPDP